MNFKKGVHILMVVTDPPLEMVLKVYVQYTLYIF